MTHHLVPNPTSPVHLPPLQSPVPMIETVPPVLDLDRRIQFVQRLAVLIRRIQVQPHVRTKENPPDES